MSDVCEFSDMPTAWCSHCRGLDEPAPDVSSSGQFAVARWEGRCPAGHPIAPEQIIALGDDGRWWHAECL